MSRETAQQVVFGITAVGAVMWVLSVNLLAKSARLMRPAKQEGFNEAPAQKPLAGRVEVEGDVKALSARAARVLASGALGPLKIMERTDGRIVFERLEPTIANQARHRWFRRGELRFTALRPNQTQIEWSVEPVGFQRLLWAGTSFQIAALVALTVGCWVMSTYVVPSPEPAVRWQSLQMLQVAHVLWPPFLFASLYRTGVRGVIAEFEALANNLPYLGEEA
jgi:hypothetical protein